MAFHDVRFPVDISYGSTGGPERKTEIIVLDSGFEQRNAPWAQSRHSYNVSYGIKSYNQLYTVKAFWEARQGPLNGFRYKDWSDYKSCPPDDSITPTDQSIGTGTGAVTTFQLVKTYTSGGNTYTRTINKPVVGTVRIAVNGTEKVLTTDFTVNSTTGIITFVSAPANGATITAGYEFDVPVRFESNKIEIDLEGFKHGSLQDIVLQELRIRSDGTG